MSFGQGEMANFIQLFRSMKFDPFIIYEDNHILILEKPAGLLSQGDHTGDENLFDLLKEYLKIKYEKPGNVYLGSIHRLDRPVGGIMLFGKTSKATSRLQDQMKAGLIKKKYLAITEKHPDIEEADLVHYLSKDESKNKSKVYDYPKKDCKICKLHYKVLANIKGLALLDIILDTGRSHQIRAQLAHMGFPIKGDSKYGNSTGIKHENLGLFAYQLGFTHPVTKEWMEFSHFPVSDKNFNPFKPFYPRNGS